MVEHDQWVEKYRPRTLDDLSIPDDLRAKCLEWIENKNLPNLLFSGDAGCGKTSLAFILKDAIAPEDTLIINASKDTGIDVVRTKVVPFVRSVSFNGPKLVIFEEADRLSPNAQDSQKALLEECSEYARFIFTCNTPERIIDPLKSRCQSFTFGSFTAKQIMTVLAKIIMHEKIKVEADQVKMIVDACGSDLRKAINTLQFATRDGVLKVSKEMLAKSEYQNQIVVALNSKNLTEVRQIVADNLVKDFTPLYRYLFDNAGALNLSKSEVDSRLIIGEYLFRDIGNPDKEINFATCCLQLMKK